MPPKVTMPAAELSHIKPFQDISDGGRVVLERGLRIAQFSKTTGVLRKGQKVSGAYVVTRGRLRVFTISPDGHEATLYTINPGETCVLALNCIFNDLLYPAWVNAEPATRVAIISGDSYRALFACEPAVQNMTVQAFSTIVFRLMAELDNVHSLKLEQRLANFLLLHAATDGSVRMTQQEIASHLGTTREVIARLLREWVRAGCVVTRRNQVSISDSTRLAAIALAPN